MRRILFTLSLTLPLALSAAVPATWTRAQLEAKNKNLSEEVQALKEKLKDCAAAPAPAPASPQGEWKLDGFEGDMALNGQGWFAGCDAHQLGSKIEWIKLAGGAAGSARSAQLKGYMPANKPPYPWTLFTLALTAQDQPKDLTGFKTLRFWAKGDGAPYRALIERAAIKDYAYPEATFTAGPQWALVELPLASFAQPSWGLAVAGGFSDATKVTFRPAGDGLAFDFCLDELSFVP